MADRTDVDPPPEPEEADDDPGGSRPGGTADPRSEGAADGRAEPARDGDGHGDDIPSRLRELGGYIRSQRTSAQLSLRNLAKIAGVSNPYLSQIERGLRKPSAEILQAIAKALSISAETLYVKAGILDERDADHDLESAIARDPHLTEDQRRALTEMYRSFRRLAELREDGGADAPEAEPPPAGGKGPLRGLIDAARALGEDSSAGVAGPRGGPRPSDDGTDEQDAPPADATDGPTRRAG